MAFLDMAKQRRSVRTFDGNALSSADLEKICECAGKADNPCGLSIEWKILDAKKDGLSSPVIAGTDCYIAGKMKKVPGAEVAFGYSFEKIVMYAWELGVGTTWIAGTMDRAAFEKAVELEEDEVMPCVSPLGYTAKKMALKESMMRKAVKADSRLPFDEVFFCGNLDTPLTEDAAGELRDALESVRVAPSAVNKQPWRVVVCEDTVHFYEKHARGFSAKSEWDIQKVDMGIALCHFALSMEEAGKKAEFTVCDPGMAVSDDMEYIASYRIC